MSAPQGVRALIWLKSREWLGDSRDQSRLWLLGLLLLGWFTLIITGCTRLAAGGDLEPERDLLFVAAAAWPLWAVIPLLGGGGGEVVAAHRLAPYPVSPRAVCLTMAPPSASRSCRRRSCAFSGMPTNAVSTIPMTASIPPM